MISLSITGTKVLFNLSRERSKCGPIFYFLGDTNCAVGDNSIQHLNGKVN